MTIETDIDSVVSATLAQLSAELSHPEQGQSDKGLRKIIFNVYSSHFKNVDEKYHAKLFQQLSLKVHPDKLNQENKDEIQSKLVNILQLHHLSLDTLQTELGNFKPSRSNVLQQLAADPNTGFKKLWEKSKIILSPMLFAYQRYYSPLNFVANGVSWLINIGLGFMGIAMLIPVNTINFFNTTLNKVADFFINLISGYAYNATIDRHINKKYSEGEANFWNELRFSLKEISKANSRAQRWFAKQYTPDFSDKDALDLYNAINAMLQQEPLAEYDSEIRTFFKNTANMTDNELDDKINSQFNQLNPDDLKNNMIQSSHQKKCSKSELIDEETFSALLTEAEDEVEKQIKDAVTALITPIGFTKIGLTFKAMGSVVLNSNLSVFRRAFNLLALIPVVLLIAVFETIRYASLAASMMTFITLVSIKAASLVVINSPLYLLDTVKYLCQCLRSPCIQDDAVMEPPATIATCPALRGLGYGESKEPSEQPDVRNFPSPLQAAQAVPVLLAATSSPSPSLSLAVNELD